MFVFGVDSKKYIPQKKSNQVLPLKLLKPKKLHIFAPLKFKNEFDKGNSCCA